jgi:hypothetical protein
MRRIRHCLLATAIAAAPMPVAAQVTVDLNALNGLDVASLPGAPPSAPASVLGGHHRRHNLARAEREGPDHETVARTKTSDVAAAAHLPPAGLDGIEHPANLGPSFTSLPVLPGAAPPVPAPPAPQIAKPQIAKPVETASATPKPTPTPEPAVPLLALPDSVPPPPPATPSRLAEATPAPQAAAPQPATPNALPVGADRLTLPFFVRENDLPPAESAMLRDFVQRHGADAHYVIRAFASPPAGDDDPSTPRRIALMRAQSVAAALTESGIEPDRLRLLALGDAGGAPADRVDVIAMPPSVGHTQTNSDSPP